MSYGPHTDMVEDVARYVREGNLLGGGGSVPGSVLTTESIDEAKRLAWQETAGPDELTWTDIRQQQLRRVRGATYGLDWYRGVDDALVALMEEFTAQVRRRLPGAYADLLDDVVGDLFSATKARAVLGSRHEFFELLLAIYHAGAWPCGWRGDYPDGRVVAFTPPRRDRQTGLKVLQGSCQRADGHRSGAPGTRSRLGSAWGFTESITAPVSTTVLSLGEGVNLNRCSRMPPPNLFWPSCPKVTQN